MRAKAAELASLRQSSPPKQVSGLGQSPARRRHEVAPEAGAATTTRFFTSFRMTARERLRGVSGPGREHPVFFK